MHHTGGGEENPSSFVGLHKMWAWWISGTVFTCWGVRANKHGVSKEWICSKHYNIVN